MLIKMTAAGNKREFYLRADLILVIERHPQNIGETLVQTSLMTPKGALSYVVIESLDAIAEAVAAALRENRPAVANKIMH